MNSPDRQGTLVDSWLAAIVESSDDAIISKDLTGTITSWNQAAEELFGYSATEAIGQPITMLAPPGQRGEMAAILEQIRRGARIRHYETVRRRKDGTLVDVSLSVSPIRDEQGNIVGASKIARDISERKRELQAKSLLAAIVESSEDAIISKDLYGIVTSWNQAAERLFGYTAEEMIGRPIGVLSPSGEDDETMAILERIRTGARVEHYETVRRRKDGSLIEISLTVSPIRDRNGTVVGASKIVRDISDRKRADQHLRELMAELDHRAKNILAVTQAMVNLTRADTTEQFAKAIRGRIGALARAHSHVAESRWHGADLQSLIEEELAPFRADYKRLSAEGPPVFVDPPTAQAFGVIIHELATNAVKYGALSIPEGAVRIEWTLLEQQGGLRLTWQERGGPPVAAPARRSFGTRLIENQVAHQLGGTTRMNWDPSGLSCEFWVPASHVATRWMTVVERDRA